MLDEYEDDEVRSWPLLAAGVGVVALAVVAVLWFGLLPVGGGGENEQISSESSQSQPAVPPSPSTTQSPTTTQSRVRPDDRIRSVDSPPVTDGADLGSLATPSTTAGRSDSAPDPSDSTANPTTEVSQPSPETYSTLPDGSPVPVLAIYDGALITLSGVVPSESAAQRLQALALANSTVPDAEVASFLTIEPTVPVGVGVRVIEMNSARFAEGSPTISMDHAAQLDRIVAVMGSLPHVSVEVIGHSDQRGDDATNFTLSADRARAAADYVASRGIDPARLSSRGAGESDLLTLNNDAAALALNRRTELVFFGLLVDPPEPA